MNFMMAGMAPVMSFLMMGRDMRAMEPTELLFWGVMSLGVMAGYAAAYPSNVWLVARRLKHGLMTERQPAETAPPRKEAKSRKTSSGHEGHGAKKSAAASAPAAMKGHDMSGGKMASMGGSGGGGGHQMEETDATLPQLAAVGGVSAARRSSSASSRRPTG